MERTCRKCGTTFIISDEEIQSYKSKNLDLPRMCKGCRGGSAEINCYASSREPAKGPSKRPYILIGILVVVLVVAVVVGIKTFM